MSDDAAVASVASRAEELAEELYREVLTPNTSHPAAPPPPPLGDLSFPVDPGADWTPAHTPRTGNSPVPGGLSFSRPGTATSPSHRSRPASALGAGGRASSTASPRRTGTHQPGSPLPSQRLSSVTNSQLVVSGGPTAPSPAPAIQPGGSIISTAPDTTAPTTTAPTTTAPTTTAPAGPTQPAPFEAGRPHPHKFISPPRVVAVDSGPYPYPPASSTAVGAVGAVGAGAGAAGTSSPGVPPLQLDLPSHVRGYTLQSISPHGTGNFATGGGAGCSPSGRALGPLAIPSERNTLPPPQAAAAASAGYGSSGGGGGGTPPGQDYYRGGGAGGGQRGPDRVDAYLARFQMHTAIRAGFRTRGDDVQRSVEDLEARLQGMRHEPQASGGEGAAAGSAREGQSPQAGTSRPHTAGGNATTSHPGPQSPPALPDPPGGRNRFAPQPTGGAFGNSRPPSASQRHAAGPASPHPQRPPSAASPGSNRGSPAHTDAAAHASGAGGAGPAGGPGAGAAGAAGQGAYLALPDGSFAGSAPFKAAPSAEGLCFERYNRHQRTTADLPEVQLRYLRPPGATAPQQPRLLAKVPRQGQPPQRSLPNGIPASRIERLSARRRSRSPPKLYQAQPLPTRHDTVTLTGAPAGTTGAGALAGLSTDDFFRSATSLGSPKGRSAAAAAAAAADGGSGALAQYLAINTAPATGEPLLDENFYAVLQQHFKSSVLQQTQQLRAHLNVSLPVVLGAMNCVNVTEAPGEAPPGTGTGTFTAATLARLQAQQQAAQVMSGSGRMMSGGGGGGGGSGESGRRA